MKQTSSALTFLMAQYRAIFKRAYVKGIATAVLLTAGLAAGAAQATEYSDQIASAIADAKDITLNNGDTLTFKNGEVGYQVAGYVDDLTINAGGLVDNSDASNLIVTGTLTLNNRGTINLTSGGLITPESNGGGQSTFDASLDGTVNLKGGIFQANNLTVGSNAKIVIEGKVTGWSSFTSGTAQEFSQLGGGNYGVNTTNEIGTSNIAGDITIGDYGQLLAYDNSEMNLIEGATISFRGTSGSSGIESAQGATLNINGATITTEDPDGKVTTGIKGAIHAETLNINSGLIEITSGNSFEIKGFKSSSKAYAGDADRGKLTANMYGGTIDNAGTLTIGSTSGGDIFNVLGGEIINAGTATISSGTTLNFNGGTFDNQKNGTFTLQSGARLNLAGTSAQSNTYTNDGSINIESGAHFTTAGAFTLNGAGTLTFKSGSTGISLAGEDVVLNNKLVIEQGVTAEVKGKVTYNGDGSSTIKVDITGSGDLNIASTGTLIINDAANTIGLTYKAGADGALGTFSGDDTFASIASGSEGILYLDVSGTGLSGTIKNADLDTFAKNLKEVLTGDSGSQLSIKLDGVTFDLGSNTITSGNSAKFSDVENVLATGVSDGQLDNTSIALTASNVSAGAQVQGSVGKVAIAADAGTSSVTVGTKTPLVLNGHEIDGVSQGTALVTVGTGDTATIGGATLQAGSNLNLAATNGTISDITADANTGTVAIAAGSSITVVDDRVTVDSVKSGVTDSTARGNIGTSSAKINTVEIAGNLDAKNVYATNLNLNSADANLVAENVTADTASITGSLTATEIKSSTSFDTVAGSALEVTELNGAKVTLAGSTTADTITATDTLTFGGDAQTKHTVKTVDAQDTVVVNQGTTVEAGSIAADKGLSVVGNATLTADSIVLSGGDLQVGTAADNGTGGTLSAGFLNLNGNNLVVDPAFGDAASIVAVAKISDNSADNEQDAQVNGSIYALRNSIIALGTDDEQLVKDTFAPILRR